MFEIDVPRHHNSDSLYDQWAEIFTVEHVCSPLSPNQMCGEADMLGNLSGNFPIVVRTHADGRQKAIAEIDEDIFQDYEYSEGNCIDFLGTSVTVAIIPFRKERFINANTPFMDAMRHLINLNQPYYLVLKGKKLVGTFSKDNFFNPNFQMMLLRFFMEIEELASHILRRSPDVAFGHLKEDQRKKVEKSFQNRSWKWRKEKENFRNSNDEFGFEKGQKYYYPNRILKHNLFLPNIGVHIDNVQALTSKNEAFSRQEDSLEMVNYFSFGDKIWAMKKCEDVRDLIPRLKVEEKKNIALMVELRNTLAHGEIYRLHDLQPEIISDLFRWLSDLRDEMKRFLQEGYLWDGSKLKARDRESGEELTDFQWPFELPERFS